MPKKESYHHKNLKNELIEQAIALVIEEGIDALSLRKIAALCGVSYAAPYAHFESKETLLSACRLHVAQGFADYLASAISKCDYADPQTLNALGVAYIDYFKQYPCYYDFLFQDKAACSATLTLDEVEGNFPPFEVFRKVCLALTDKFRLSKEEGLARLVQCWAMVHGVSALMISPNIRFDGDWYDCI